MGLERLHRLIDQSNTVGEEEDSFGPVAAHQHIGQGNDGARLAGASGHHDQGLALVIHFKACANPAHGAILVIAFDDVGVDNGIGQFFAAAAPLNHQRQFRLFEETLHRTRRIAHIVPQPMLIAIGAEDDGALAVPCFKAIGVELGLLLAGLGILLRAFGFNQRQRLAVITPQHVIDKAFALVVGHAADFNLEIPLRIEVPAGFLEQQVDEVIAGFGFGIIVGVRLGGVGFPGGGEFFTQRLECFVKRGLVGEQRRELFVALMQL